MMLITFAIAALSAPTSVSAPQSPRLGGEDLYCAAIAVHLSEAVQARSPEDPVATAGVAAMLLYFLGRVEAAVPTADGAEAVLDMAQVIGPQTITQAEIEACSAFMGAQTAKLIDEAQGRGRALR